MGSNPHEWDTDGDGLNDYSEYEYDTNPKVKDTDGDHIPDAEDPQPTLVEYDKPNITVPKIYASDGKWYISNFYAEDNVGIESVDIYYYVGSTIEVHRSFKYDMKKQLWLTTSIDDDVWDYVAGNKIEIVVTDVNGNKAYFNYTHDLYSDLSKVWSSISKYISGAIVNAVKALISAYPGLAPLIALAWGLGESLWSNSIGGLIDIVKNPMQFVNGIKSFIAALEQNGVLNTIKAILGSIEKEIKKKVDELVAYISDVTKRDAVESECFDMYVVGDIIGFVVSMALQPGGFASDLGGFIEKVGSDAGKLGEAFGKIADTIEKMKSLLEDVKSTILGKLMEKCTALKNAVKELVQAGKMSEKVRNALNKIFGWLGKKGIEENEALVKEATQEIENGANAKDVEDAIDDIRSDSGVAGKPEKEKELLEAEEYAIKEVGLTGEKAKIFHEVLRRGLVSEVDKTDAEFLKKVAEYIKYSDKNPLDAGEDTVVRFMKAKDVTTQINGETIEDFAVLLQKDWEHIKIRHIGSNAEGTPFRYADGRYLSDEEVRDLIEYGLKKGYVDTVHNNDPTKYIVIACKLQGYWGGRGIRIIVSKEYGNIITAYLTTAV